MVETVVPSAWIKEHDYVRPRWVGAGGVGINVCHYDPLPKCWRRTTFDSQRKASGPAAGRVA